MKDEFVNLHCHTLYSKQDSIIKIDELADKVKEFGQSACAVTDHSSTAAFYYFKKEADRVGIKPIYGNEFYVNTNNNLKSRNRDHLVCLAMNDEGVKNINRMQDIAVRHHYYKPILPYDNLIDHSYGIYATSACSLGAIPKLLYKDKIDEAWDCCDWFMDLFDENFSLELQIHPDYKEQHKINHGLVKLHDLTGIPLTVSTDAHFLDESVRDIRRIVQAISWKTTYDEVNDSLESNCVGSTELILKFVEQTNENILKNEEEDISIDLGIIREAIKQTNKIAKLCNADLCNDDRKVPIFSKYEEFDRLFDEVM